MLEEPEALRALPTLLPCDLLLLEPLAPLLEPPLPLLALVPPLLRFGMLVLGRKTATSRARSVPRECAKTADA